MFNNNKNTKFSAVLASIALSLALQGCASTVLRPVSESNRDVAGNYNGVWKTVVTNTTPIQQLGGDWTITCEDMQGQTLGTFSVDNGIATLGEGSGGATAFVSQSGKFRFELPIAEVAASSGTSDSKISNGNMKIIMFGSLDKGAGKLTYGIAEFGYNGCTSKIGYNKI